MSATITAEQFASMLRAYSIAHTKGAYRVRCDAYGLAVNYITTGRADQVKPKAIHAMINGGRCVMAPVRAAIADARRDCAAL